MREQVLVQKQAPLTPCPASDLLDISLSCSSMTWILSPKEKRSTCLLHDPSMLWNLLGFCPVPLPDSWDHLPAPVPNLPGSLPQQGHNCKQVGEILQAVPLVLGAQHK